MHGASSAPIHCVGCFFWWKDEIKQVKKIWKIQIGFHWRKSRICKLLCRKDSQLRRLAIFFCLSMRISHFEAFDNCLRTIESVRLKFKESKSKHHVRVFADHAIDTGGNVVGSCGGDLVDGCFSGIKSVFSVSEWNWMNSYVKAHSMNSTSTKGDPFPYAAAVSNWN